MELDERRFLTADDRRYLEEVELTLTRVHGVPPERAGRAARILARDLHRLRALSRNDPAEAIYPYGGAKGHAEVVAALLISPRAPSGLSLAVLALLAAVAGLLGIRVVLGLIFRRIEPVRIGPLDVVLAVVVVGIILAGTSTPWLFARLGRANWLVVSLVLGLLLGFGATALLRRWHVQGTIVTIPFWLAAALATLCAALTWLLTWPDDQRIAETKNAEDAEKTRRAPR